MSEENNTQNESQSNNTKPEENKKTLQDNWKKYLLITFGAFVGAFLAVYVVADMALEKHFFYMTRPAFYDLRDIDELIKDEDDTMKDFMNYHQAPNPFVSEPVKIQTVQEDDFYKIIMDLKAFNGDDKNITIKAKPHSVKIEGKYDSKTKNAQKDVVYVQSFSLPEEIDTAKVTKKKDGNKCIITLPIKED